jgi:FkbM family methyltransferase
MLFRYFSRHMKNGEGSQRDPTDVFSEKPELFTGFKVMLDIGAHRGNIIRRFRQLAPEAYIHAFEPSQTTFRILKNDFGSDPKVSLSCRAVSDTVGTAEYYENSFEETNSLLPSVPVDNSIDVHTRNRSVTRVDTTTMDEYALKNDLTTIDFAKIDAQGNTFAILEGAELLLGGKAIKWVYAEVEFVEIYKNEKRFSEIELLMRKYDYSFVNFYNLNYTETGRLAWADALFSAEYCS